MTDSNNLTTRNKFDVTDVVHYIVVNPTNSESFYDLYHLHICMRKFRQETT